MSLVSNTVPIAFFGLASLGFVSGVHEFSKSQTTTQLEQIEETRAAHTTQLNQEYEDFLTQWRVQKQEARKAEAAQARAEMIASLPGNPKKGRMTYMTCLGCHGLKAEGSRGFKAPRLAGQAPWYLKRQLEKFRDGVRGAHPSDPQGAQMAPMARMLRGTAVDDVVAFIATIDPGKPADTGAGDASSGDELFAICATCHGPAAQGLEAQKGPRLSHQHAWYLAGQLKKFQGGVRGAHAADLEGQQMAAIAQTLSDEQAIANLIAFIQSLDQ
ncbi:MAG: c-type cytochrome [Gemmatimonadetes bacterium]|nr:c-type cytochrome [Gemmatimonadota bacterium]MBT5059421.1 c-type cytochrome [Gemmatimonadota bacterium]MBT5146509.1 c-type cytochrome [Gemmatimonadota bacterium]MBT5591430.1 c-type cytochrome [Gemmatimonadota bacterium]MBT5962115.1 c-type cytochrome [Gemmatimonadota bacterium]